MINQDIDKLAVALGLSAYQKNVLKSNPGAYKLSGLVKRGGALYAPRIASSHVLLNFIYRLLYGRSADLIGYDKMLVHNQYGIKLFLGGFYSAPIGRFKYYADDKGNIVARNCVRGN